MDKALKRSLDRNANTQDNLARQLANPTLIRNKGWIWKCTKKSNLTERLELWNKPKRQPCIFNLYLRARPYSFTRFADIR